MTQHAEKVSRSFRIAEIDWRNGPAECGPYAKFYFVPRKTRHPEVLRRILLIHDKSQNHSGVPQDDMFPSR